MSADQTEQNQPQQSTEPKKSNNQALKVVLIVLGVLAVLAILGTVLAGYLFKKGTETFIGSLTDGDVQISEDGITYEDEDGSFTTGAQMPDDFPSEVPLFEPHEVSGSMSQQDGDSRSYFVNFLTAATGQEVGDFYAQALNDDGWSVVSSSTFNGGATYSAEHGSGLSLVVNINSDAGTQETVFAISVEQR